MPLALLALRFLLGAPARTSGTGLANKEKGPQFSNKPDEATLK